LKIRYFESGSSRPASSAAATTSSKSRESTSTGSTAGRPSASQLTTKRAGCSLPPDAIASP
jgi:hypothetical protein